VVVGNAPVLIYRNLHQIADGCLTAFPDCLRNLAGLSKACTHMTVAVADYYQSRESHGTSAFYSLGYTLDCYYIVI
jgi:hypothetical protein